MSCPLSRFLVLLFGLLVPSFSQGDSSVLHRRRGRFRSPASWPLNMPYSASSSWPTRRSGRDEYLWEGSIWKTPLELDAFNDHPEPYGIYLFHMTLGHHGIFSLTPIFLFSIMGAARLLWGGGRPFAVLRGRGTAMAAMAWLTTVLTVVVLAFYTWNPKARNYGGSTQGLRWLFWLIPFGCFCSQAELRGAKPASWVRCLALLALGISVVSVGYAIRNPWSHPWILDALEHLDLYPLLR